jgi:hypothetical protein
MCRSAVSGWTLEGLVKINNREHPADRRVQDQFCPIELTSI